VLLALAIILFKTLLIYALGRMMRAEPGVALRTGLVLAQGGSSASRCCRWRLCTN